MDLLIFNPLVPAVLCFLSVVVVFAGLASIVGGRLTMVDRFQHYVWQRSTGDPNNLDERTQGALVTRIDAAISKKRRSDLTRDLARADLQFTPGEFVILSVTCVAAAFGIGLIIFKVWYVALLVAVLGYYVPRIYLRFRQARRESAFSAQLPNALNLLATSMRSGYSLLQAMDLLAREMQPPISVEFARVVREMGLGVDLETALNNMQRRMENQDLDLIITVILINHQIGGNLATILDMVSHTIRERVRIKGEIRILTAQQQLSGYFVGSLPFLLSVLLFLINPSYMGQSFNSICGQAMFFTAFALVGVAFVFIRRIVAIEV